MADKFSWNDDDELTIISSPWDISYKVPTENGHVEMLVQDFNGLMQHLMQANPDGDLDKDFRIFMASEKAKHMPSELRDEIEAAGVL